MRFLILVFSLCFLVNSSLIAEQSTNELDKLQGEWQAIEFIGCGFAFPQQVVNHLKVTIKGDRLSYVLPRFDDPTRPSNVKVDAEITIGPGDPQTIDVRILQGRTKSDPVRGVYEQQGDKLRICLSSGGPGTGNERITSLGPSRTSRATQMTLRRFPGASPSNQIAGSQMAR